jgi:ubiquinone/menaquinone biosynthesis C-methylase UbiE
VKKLIYPAPVYMFLDYIYDEQTANPALRNNILDCGAGGKQPPLGLFAEHGFETWGIDISDKQLVRAQAFAEENGANLKLQKGDMRSIPFEDEKFNFVYEFYSICHLSKVDTRCAIMEMRRVLKKGGLLFVGFMSSESWPIMGQEISPREFSLIENEQPVLHNVYRDNEPEDYFLGFEIIYKEKRISRIPEKLREIPQAEWERMYPHLKSQYSETEWLSLYTERASLQNYTHLYYIARKPLL